MIFFNKRPTERTYTYTEKNVRYTIGETTAMIYHIQPMPDKSDHRFRLPNGIKGLLPSAISDLRSIGVESILVPATYKDKKFAPDLSTLDKLQSVYLAEGIEQVSAIFSNKTAVNIILPTTIKVIGPNCYPIKKHLVLPEGTIEISKLFASHDLNLLSVVIPGTIKNVPDHAFNQCKNLQKVVLNEGVESSGNQVFRGTNNLHELVIPSTYNGTFHFSMEARGGRSLRGNSTYIPLKFEEEKEHKLNIKIKRGEKSFEFNIRRGECSMIKINNNKILIGTDSIGPGSVLIDCSTLEQGIYTIENGKLMQQKSNEHDSIEELFSKAFSEYIEPEDFADEGLTKDEQQQVIEYMKAEFARLYEWGIKRADAAQKSRLFNDAVRKVKSERETISTPHEALSPPTMQQQSNEHSDNRIEELFFRVFSKYIGSKDFEDKGLTDDEQQQVIEYMKAEFANLAKLGIIRTDPDQMSRLFNDAVRKLRETATILDDLPEEPLKPRR